MQSTHFGIQVFGIFLKTFKMNTIRTRETIMYIYTIGKDWYDISLFNLFWQLSWF